MATAQDNRLFQVFATSQDAPAVVVAVNLFADCVNAPPAMPDSRTFRAITHETFSLAQFRGDVDKLITQLEALKVEAEGVFAAYETRR